MIERKEPKSKLEPPNLLRGEFSPVNVSECHSLGKIPETIPLLKFNIVEVLESRRKDGTLIKDYPNEEITYFRFMDSPDWMHTTLTCQLPREWAEHDGISVCLDRAVDRLRMTTEYKLWDDLMETVLSEKWADDNDLNEFNGQTYGLFSFPVNLNNGRKDPFKSRILKSLLGEISKVARVLRISPNHLAQRLLLDGLRANPETRNRELLDLSVNSFYKKIRRRLLLAGNEIRVYERLNIIKELSPGMKEILDNIDYCEFG